MICLLIGMYRYGFNVRECNLRDLRVCCVLLFVGVCSVWCVVCEESIWDIIDDDEEFFLFFLVVV